MRYKTFEITIHDLVFLANDPTITVTVETFDKEIGTLLPRGIIFPITGLDDDSNRYYTINQRREMKKVLRNIKTIQEVKKAKPNHRMIVADRRFSHDKLMTMGNGVYNRPKHQLKQ